jgi:thiamine-monophosphate kinase
MSAEFDFIDWLRRRQPTTAAVPVPAGDDLAVLAALRPDDLLLVGVDQVLQGVHFDLSQHAATDVGRKAMNRNLSDCAAMGCLPAAAVLTLALPRDAGDLARQLYEGVEAAGLAFDCPIVGGDTGSWPGPLAVTVTILGRTAGVPPVTRRGVRPGDGLWVSGPLGGSILGRHLTFTPRVHAGRTLASHSVARAMIDLSDGLSRDVRHLCRESNVGVEIEADAIPIHADARTLAKQSGKHPLHHALHDGEDYELLAAVAADASAEAIAMQAGFTKIGRFTADTGQRIVLSDGRVETLEPLGWEHRL